MSKHPVPKKKTPKSTSKQRYASFVQKTLKKLTNRVKLVKCPDCGATIPAHTACPDCGKYRGRQVIDKQKEIDKITTIKA